MTCDKVQLSGKCDSQGIGQKVLHADKWYLDKPEAVQKIEMHKILYEFEIQTNHAIPAKKQKLMLTNKTKGNCSQVDFVASVNERKRKHRKIHRCCQRAEKATEHEGSGDTNCSSNAC